MLDLPTVITTLLRHLLGVVGAYLVGKGLLTDSQATQIIGLGVALAGQIIWSLIEKRFSESKFFKLINAAKELPPDATKSEMKAKFADPAPLTKTEEAAIKEAVKAA